MTTLSTLHVHESSQTIPVSFFAIGPELVLLICALVLIAGAIFLPERAARLFSALVAAGALVGAEVVAALQFNRSPHFSFDHTIRVDAFGASAQLIIFAAALLAVLVSWGGAKEVGDRSVEFYALLLTATAGMALLTVANSFVIVFVALELFSLALYILVAIELDALSSLEASLKYLVVGSVGAAFLLYGSAFIYGATGQLEFDRIRAVLSAGGHHNPVLLIGVAMVIVGLGFKSNAAPFHMWTPDAYEGAPTTVTAFMAAATKTTALIVTLRVLVTAFPAIDGIWQDAIGAIAIVSFAVGNLAALRQTNVKRMLAYSTVGHTGFLLTAVAAHSVLGTEALLYYLVMYAAMNVGAFAVVAVREREIGRPVQISDFRGYGYSRPWLGAAMLIFLLSLAGFPPTGGFIGKLTIFSAAVASGQTYLAIAGIVATMVALVYYLRIPAAMYDREAPAPTAVSSVGEMLSSTAALVGAGFVLAFGIVPGPIFDLARTATTSLLGG